MDTTTLGRTGLNVSVAGLGCGGFSRLGLSTGGTEAIVGQAISHVPRDSVVLATKGQIVFDGVPVTPERLAAAIDASLRQLGTDHIDIYQLHGISPAQYDQAMALVPVLLKARDQGKIRFLGITESGAGDHDHTMLQRAVADGVWDVGMVAFNMLHRTASDHLFPATQAAGVGTLVMHAVRSIFARPDFLATSIRDLAAAGKVAPELAHSDAPLDFLVHPEGAASVTEAAYRFARHSAGVDVVLFGTGSAAHLKANVAALNRPPLPPADLERLFTLFGAVSGLGLESPPAVKKPQPPQTGRTFHGYGDGPVSTPVRFLRNAVCK